MKVHYSRRAANDLESVREYLYERSPRGAVNVLAAIYLTIEFIRRNPEAAETTTISSIRAKTVRKYRFKIFYRVVSRDDLIEIVHVRHHIPPTLERQRRLQRNRATVNLKEMASLSHGLPQTSQN